MKMLLVLLICLMGSNLNALSCAPDSFYGSIRRIEDHSHKTSNTYMIVHMENEGDCGGEIAVTVERNNLSESSLKEIKKNLYLSFTTDTKISLPLKANQTIFDDTKAINLYK